MKILKILDDAGDIGKWLEKSNKKSIYTECCYSSFAHYAPGDYIVAGEGLKSFLDL
jgi:hypothetical protein